MKHSESIKELAAALLSAQSEMPAVAFDSTNPFLRNRYASLKAVIDTSRPILAKHGLSICQLPVSEGDQVGVESVLLHTSGEWLAERMLMPLGDEKGKSRAQVAGSVVTYFRRYGWQSLLGIYAEEDTDGNAPEGKPAPRQAPAQRQTTPPMTKPAAKAPTPAELEQKRQAWIAECKKAGGGSETYAHDFFIESGVLLDTESLDDFPLSKLPKTRGEARNILAEISTRAGVSNGGNAPQDDSFDAATPDADSQLPDSRPRMRGYIKLVNKKTGSSARGAWTCYSILLVEDMADRQGGTWFSTFHTDDGKIAERLKGKLVEVVYEEGEKGNTLADGGIVEDVTP